MKLSALLTTLVGSTAVLGALDAKIKAKGKLYYGNILDSNTISNTNAQNILRTEFGAITAENSWKWDSTEPQRGSFQFGNADRVANWAQQNGKLLRGHTLVWHSQLPGWVSGINDRNTLKSVIENHIQQLAGRYKGRVAHWDVVNEVFEDNGSFRNSVFYRVLGEEFIDIAFRKAREVDPQAKLYINDYNLDYEGPKINALISLVNRLRDRGTPVDGIGSQCHLIAGNVGQVAATIQKLAATGLDVAITELDIRIRKPVNQQGRQQQQADYNTVTKACLAVEKCVGITVWGISDANSWVDSTFPDFDEPLLYSDNWQQKLAYQGADQAMN